jgi:hypothetical protein
VRFGLTQYHTSRLYRVPSSTERSP